MYLYNNLCSLIAQRYTDHAETAFRSHLSIRKQAIPARKKPGDPSSRKPTQKQ